MTIKYLNKELKKLGVSDDKYYLHGLYGSTDDNEKLALAIKRGKYTIEYEVYYRERDEKYSKQLFTSETKACEYFLHKIQEEITIEKVQNVIGLNGMTVNERLFVSGLMPEFDKTKKNNLLRAIEILQEVGLDKKSIYPILKI